MGQIEYILSPDGSTVYRLVPQGTVSASTLDTSLLANGFTAQTGNTGSVTVTSYNAGFDGGGGAQIEALYDAGAPLPAGDVLQWVQVITTNAPASGSTSPYLDNAMSTDNPTAPDEPFYTETVANKTASLPSTELNFYDYSRRPTSALSTANPVTWSADLYPVLWNTATNSLTVENGVSWGWTEASATVGTDTGTFIDPEPAGATVTGVGTSDFTWGDGDPSSLDFTGGSFDATVGVPFKLGTLVFTNGANTNDPDSVTFEVSVDLTNVPEKNFVLDSSVTLINTPNTDDPVASADTVSLGGYGYSFHVEEGDSASVDVYATISTGLSGSTAGVVADSRLSSSDTLGTNPGYSLNIVGLENASSGGFVTTLNISEAQSQQVVGGFEPSTPFAGTTLVDSTSGLSQTVTVTLSAPGHGTLSNLGDGSYDSTTGTYTDTGTNAQVVADLDGLEFTPTPFLGGSGDAITTNFEITDTDADGAAGTSTVKVIALGGFPGAVPILGQIGASVVVPPAASASTPGVNAPPSGLVGPARCCRQRQLRDRCLRRSGRNGDRYPG